jgi:hypothetical protein
MAGVWGNAALQCLQHSDYLLWIIIIKNIKKPISDNKIVIYMKSFSNTKSNTV